MENKYLLEIVQVHQFLEGWIAGKIEKTKQEFLRFTESLAADFVIIYPNGQVKNRETLISEIWDAHGARSPSFSIEIRKYQCRFSSDTICAVTYEEWLHDTESSGRICTAVLRHLKDQDSMEWILVHETWLKKFNISFDSSRHLSCY